MKKILPPKLSLAVSLAALLAGLSASGAIVPTEWRHRQALTVGASGLVRVELPDATFDAALPAQEDLRIVDSSGREIPLLVERPPIPTARTIQPASLHSVVTADATVLTIVTGTTDPLDSIILETPHPFFLRPARIEISQDGSSWSLLDQGVPLFRQWGAEQLELSLASRPAAQIRITVDNLRGPPLPFTGARLAVVAGTAPEPVPVGASLARRDEFAGETVLALAVGGRHLPLASLAVDTAEPLFMREITVAVREIDGTAFKERVVGSGTVYRVALAGAPVRSQLEIKLDHIPATRELLVHIHNGDSPPLAVEAIRVKRRPIDLLFLAPVAGNYFLLSGNPQVSAPHYDLASFASDMRTATATLLRPGAVEETPEYHPRATLTEPPLPDVPLLGAPLDVSGWTRRQTVEIAAAGIQECELNPAALAGARPDFADLRLVRAGNQVPYVLEQPALARGLDLTPIVQSDPRRPATSIWQLKLPHAGLPLLRIKLATRATLFQREFHLFEKVTDPDGRTYEHALASGMWNRTPESGAAESIVFDLMDRPRNDILFLETNNGDNPPIVLDSVVAMYPVVRLVFKAEQTDGFSLVYGNASIAAPRYDLRLVASKLLTASRGTAHLGGEDTTQQRSPFFALQSMKGGVLFWAALTLVVVILLVIVAKLLPKPPTSQN